MIRFRIAMTLAVVGAVLLLARVSPALADSAHATPSAANVEKTAEGHATTDAGHAAEEPSLLRGPKESLITAITTLLVFLLLVVVLSKAAWGPIASGLQAREDKIRKDIADAESARLRAEATLKEYESKLAAAQSQIRDMLSKAQQDGEAVSAGIKVKAQQDAEEIKERATKEIDASRKAAVAEIHEHAATLATSVAERILKRSINADDQRDLVKTSIEQMHSLGRN